ncbi:MAG: TolC family outer membrane protein [Brevundimonas sp.]
MLNRSRAFASAAALALAAGLWAGPASAETLRDAIALAYRTNPSLLAQRANQRALDETVVQARAGLRPELNVTASANYTRTDSAGGGVDINGDGIPDVTTGGVSESNNGNVSIGLSQTLYTGGRVSRAISAAEAGVLEGRENLRDLEQQVIVAVVQAYVDVLRDVEILEVRRENLQVLRRQLDESNARFEVGEITRTDVAQSEARLAQAEADLATAEAQLSTSRAAYAAVVGQSPSDLAAPAPLIAEPQPFEAALDVALDRNPGLLAAAYNQRQAEENVAQARAAFRPTAGLTASYGGSDELRGFDPTQSTAFRAGATVSVPLFTGGLNRSRVAQALEQANAAQIQVENERRTVLQEASQAYAGLISARAGVTANEEAVRAARVAAEGVRQEQSVGLRTTLDVLNAELELRNAQINLAVARRNDYVAQAQLLAAMGSLDAPSLADVEAYDPAENYERVRNRGALPWDFAVEAIDGIAAPPVQPANDAEDAPIDQQLKSEVVRTAP